MFCVLRTFVICNSVKLTKYILIILCFLKLKDSKHLCVKTLTAKNLSILFSTRLWDSVQNGSTTRGKGLDATLEAARRFWQQLGAVMATLADLQDALHAQPPPAAQPRDIQHQQLALQEIRHEIDHTKPEVSSYWQAAYKRPFLGAVR